MGKRIKRMMMWSVGLVAAGQLCFVIGSDAASFDCGRASTKVEKMICSDSELSRLDCEMADIYKKALPKAPDLTVVKKQQKDWLKERNHCTDRRCLNDQYQLRLGELQRIVDLKPLSNTEESHYFDKESEKLKVIQDVARRQPFVWYHPYMQEPEYCTEFKKNFIKGLYIEAVEPNFRTNDMYDARFAKLNRCEDPQIHPNQSFENEFWGIRYLGGPPFRYYSLELDGNLNNGDEEILYSEQTETDSGTGYTWIDSQGCLIRAGAGQSTRWQETPRYLYRLTTLVKYEGEFIMVGLSPTPWAPDPTSYYFDMKRFCKKEPRGCHWSFKVIKNK